MKEMICRLCLQTIGGNNCQPVDGSVLKSLKLNINVSKENVACIECTNGLRVFSNFTPGCAYTEEETLPLSDLHNGVKLDPEKIETTSNSKPLVETEIKCSFCTKAYGREALLSLQESKENKFMVDMLKQYFSETNLRDAEELLTCETCLEALRGILSVILKCLKVEEKINKYIKIEGTDDKGQVELRKVQEFTFKPIIKSEIESLGVNALEDRSDQVQDEHTTMAETDIKYEKEIRDTELIIKTEVDDIASEQIDCDIHDIQSDCDGFQELLMENKGPSEIKMFQCELCPYESQHKSNIQRHSLTHKSPSQIKMFKCELCSYEAKWKYRLKAHLLTHESPSEVILKMFKCDLCSYEAKQKYNLRRHLLNHRSPTKIKKIFKCTLCSYEARYKDHLRSHLLTHKSPSDNKMFKCEMCSFEAKHKIYLRQHLVTHKRPHIKMFECDLCPYEAMHKRYLKQHLLTHKSCLEIKTFQCELCSYEGKRKHNLKQHLLTHSR